MTDRKKADWAPMRTDDEAEAAILSDDLSVLGFDRFVPWNEFARRHGLDVPLPPRLAGRVEAAAAAAGVTPGRFVEDAVEKALAEAG